jgi:hypothetical protein
MAVTTTPTKRLYIRRKPNDAVENISNSLGFVEPKSLPSTQEPISVAKTLSANVSAMTLPLFAATLFLSAFLLFGVQPMFTKMVLPQLGGTPAVWSVAMVVFQTLLLFGYAYAHGLIRLMGPRAALMLHLAVMAIAVPFLPIAVTQWAGNPPDDGQAIWLVGVFAASIGMPFFALAANGPLLQAWFARTGHSQAQDPYFLYGASNIGSFAALVAYPFIIEPLLPLSLQSIGWYAGFAILATLVMGCGLIVLRTSDTSVAQTDQAIPAAEAVTWHQRWLWIGLAGVPSALLVSATAHISTDVASAPLLWVVPLAIYLLTFVIAFRPSQGRHVEWLVRAQIWGAGLVFFSLAISASQLWWTLSVHLGAFFAAAMACHLALYRSRPGSARLTEFYLCISFGGMIGGLFCGLIAPHIFSTVAEYPIAMLLSLAAIPILRKQSWRAPWSHHQNTVIAALVIIAVAVGAVSLGAITYQPFAVLVGAFAAGMMLTWRATLPILALGFVTMLVVTSTYGSTDERVSIRSFFGVHKIMLLDGGRFRALGHGTTIHGAMMLKNEDGSPVTGKPEPTTYYAFDGAIGDAIAKVRIARGGTLKHVAAIGLGTGSLACHITPGEAWTYYEIDPDVVRIARDPRYFRFISECAPGLPVVMGDARLRIVDHPGNLDLIVIDAFSSDAIPTHLMTREAMSLYASKLAPGGAALFHISNRHMDLSKVMAATAAAEDLQLYLRQDQLDGSYRTRYKTPAIAAVVMRKNEDIPDITSSPSWRRIEPPASHAPWTDDYANIMRAILDHHQAP